MSETPPYASNDGQPPPPANRRLRGIEAVRLAKAYLHEFTGKVCEQASGVAATEEGWVVALEAVELERIPRTTDILGSYVVTLDHEGELLSYERVSRYCRSQVRDGSAGGGGEM